VCLGAPRTTNILTAYSSRQEKFMTNAFLHTPWILPWNDRNQAWNNFFHILFRARRTYTGDAAPPPVPYIVADKIEELLRDYFRPCARTR
jgi:hypothetical protein